MKLRIKKTHPAAVVPTYASDGAAAFDLHAVVDFTPFIQEVVNYTEPLVVRTGLAFEVPEGWALMIYSRSGHGFHFDTRLANCVGVIDSDYRGEVLVKLTRDPRETLRPTLRVGHGDRIAQAMLVEVPRVTFEVAEQLTLTERADGGFGSTGT